MQTSVGSHVPFAACKLYPLLHLVVHFHLKEVLPLLLSLKMLALSINGNTYSKSTSAPTRYPLYQMVIAGRTANIPDYILV